MKLAVFSRYPGSKENRTKEFLDGQLWDTIIEPFVGAGWCSLRAGARDHYIADASDHVWAMWQSLIVGAVEEIKKGIKLKQDAAVKNFDSVWEGLKNTYKKHTNSSDLLFPSNLAITGQCLHKLSFGGVVRHGANGQLNIKYVEGQIPEFLRWEPNFPDLSKSGFRSVWNLSKEWPEAIQAFSENPNPGKTIAIIDPPYYATNIPGMATKRKGTGTMTAAYPGHKPHDRDTFMMATSCLEEIAKLEVNRIVWCNYYNPDFDSFAIDIANRYGFTLTSKSYNRCDRMNRGNGEARVFFEDYVWFFDRL